MTEYGHKIKEEVKTIQSEIRKNVHGTKSDATENRTQINNMNQKEGRNIQPEQNEETIQKKEERLWNL